MCRSFAVAAAFLVAVSLCPLTHAQTVSGNVSSPFGPVVNTEVLVADSGGNFVVNAYTDGSGDYAFDLPGDGDFWIFTPQWNLSDFRLLPEVHPDTYCLNCDPVATGSPVNVTGGVPDTPTVDFFLDEGVWFSGHISETGNPGLDLHPVEVNVLTETTGEYLNGTITQPDGNYYLPAMLPGRYKLLFRTAPDPFMDGYLDELYDEIPCQSGVQCDITTEGFVFDLSAGMTVNEDLTRGFLISGLLINDFGGPLPWAVVDLHDSSGNFVGQANPGDDDTWGIAVASADDYYALTPDWSVSGFTPEAWNDHVCNPCDPLVVGDPITVSGGDVGGIDFQLSGGFNISGNVQDDVGGNLQDVEVCAAKRSSGLYLGCSVTDASGNYDIGGLQNIPDDIIAFINDTGPNAVAREMWDNQPCCDFNQADIIDMSGGSVGGINFQLDPAAVFSGIIEEDGSPGTPVHPVDVILIDPAGNWVASTTNQPDGSYELPPVALGDYRLYFEANGAAAAYLDEMYDEFACPNYGCDFSSQGDLIPAVAGPNVINEELVLGFVISGTVLDGSSNPINGAVVDVYDDSFNLLGNSGTDPGTGAWSFTVAAPGNYYAITPDWSIPGWVPEAWDNHSCSACDWPSVADPIVVSSGDVGGINFVLEPGYQIFFLIGDEFGFPISEGYVDILDGSGNWLQSAWNNGDGTAQSSLLPNGTYYAYAWGEDWNRTTQLFDGVPCPFATCDILALGTPIVISGGDQGPHEFELAWRSEDWTISGHIWDAGGNPGPGGAMSLFNQVGQHMGDFWVDGNGYFETWPLADGTYYATTRYSWETLDEAWDNIPCQNNTCDPTSATPIVVSGGNVSGIDFFLDPIAGGGRIQGTLIDDANNPLANAGVVVFNNQGNYLTEVGTDGSGFFSTQLLANDDYYIRTHREPGGLGRELWVAQENLSNIDLNVVCAFPPWDCDNPPFVTGNGTPININNGDFVGADFVLSIPPGGQISGHVFDQVIWDQGGGDFPLYDVQLSLLMDDGGGNFNHVSDVQTDLGGNFTFSGLPDGDYKLFTSWIPWSGYEPECFGDQYCDWGTDFSDPANGTVVTISGGSVFSPADFGLNNVNTRIVGTVTRSGSGEPVSSNDGYFSVDLWDDAGNGSGGTGTNSIGQYQYDLGENQWMLSTSHDTQAHNLINEAWTAGGGLPCSDDCNPFNVGGDVIDTTGGGTFIANFQLDTATIISGTVTAANGGAPIANIEICTARQSDGWWAGCGYTDGNGDYEIRGLEPRADYEVFTANLNGQPFQPGGYPGLVDTTGGDVGGIDFALDDAFSIFGTITEAGSGTPLTDGAACLFNGDGSFAQNCAGLDPSGNYEFGGLYPGDYIVAAFVPGYRNQVYDGQECINNFCNFAAGTLIPVGNPGDAFGIDFALTPTATITGTVSNTGGLLTFGAGRARISDPSGNTFMQVQTDENGVYRAEGLDPGTYYVLGVGRDSNHIDEIWAGDVNLDVYCPRLSCDEATVGTPIVITGSETVSNIDFVLQAGSRINAFITIEGAPASTSMNLYDGDGDYAGFGFTDGAGNFQSFSGFPAGTWYAANRFVVNGIEQPDERSVFVPTMYADGGNPPDNSVDCGFPCDIAATIPSATGITTDGSTDSSLPSTYNYVFQPDASISGTLLANDLSQVGGAVRIFDSNGNHVTDAWVFDEFGNWNSGPLSAGTYYLVTGYTWADVIDDAWDGFDGSPCVNQTCDLTATTPVLIQGGVDVTGIDFRLDPIVGGGRIEGTVVDSLGDGVPELPMIFFNNQGNYLFEVRTDATGFFSTQLLVNDDYYVRTDREPFGLGRELWVAPEDTGNPDLNVFCGLPPWDCDNPGFITANGSAITVLTGDTTGIDFVLSVPPGGQITGHVFDEEIWNQSSMTIDFPLMEVDLALLMDDGFGNFNHITNTQTDRDGNYTFSGLPDGDYKLFSNWVPWPGYEFECYGGQYCDWGTDFNDPANGDVITITGGSVAGSVDLALDNFSDRIVGTVTRSGTGEPISSNDGYFSVDLWDDAGNGSGGTGTNAIGQYFYDVGPNQWMLSTSHDTQAHNLINEAWDNHQCFDDCNPFVVGGDVINLTGGTFLANFVLDPATTISGRVTAANGGAPIANIEICSSRQSDGGWTGCGWTDGNGDYEIKGLEPRNDYEVFTNNLNGQPYQGASYPGLVDTTGGNVGGIDFALDDAFSINGTITESGSGTPIEGVTACLFDANANWMNNCTGSDPSGNYQLTGLFPGDYIVAVFPDNHRHQVYDGQECLYNLCNFAAGTPIPVGNPGDAFGIDFILTPTATITGTVSDINGLLTFGAGRARISDTAGNTLRQVTTDENGFYSAGGFEPGTYFVLGVGRDSNLIDEIWAGDVNLDVYCPRLSCDEAAVGTPIVIGGTETVGGIDFVLQAGSRITAFITIEGAPADTGMYLYDSDGDRAGFGFTDGAGNFASFSGFPAGTWYASNRFVVNGIEQNTDQEFMPTMYADGGNPPDNSVDCGFPCDIAGTIPSATGITTDGSTDSSLPSTYNYVFQPDASISGTLLANDLSQVGGAVRIFDSNGNHVTDAWVFDEFGNWNSGPLSAGTYYLATGFTWADVIDDAWDGIDGSPCVNQTCDITATTPAVIQGGVDVTGIDFRLDPIVGGGRIQGSVDDDTGNGVPYAGVVVFNNQGQYLIEVGTDTNGNFSTPLLANDDYYIHTNREPGGLGRELFVAPEDQINSDLNVVCALPPWDCDNPPFITGNGTSININNADFVDANFVLSIPPGGQISGHVFDQVIWDLGGGDFPLYDVEFSLLMDDGFGNFNHVSNVQSDRGGNYTFAGLPDGHYKLFTSWIPWSGYEPECFGDQYCDWGTDFNDPANGTVVTISGGSVFSPADFGLNNVNDRIVGTVTRSDTGEPVSSDLGFFSVDLWDTAGNGSGGTGTNSIGQYQYDLGPEMWMLSTSHDTQAHNLINEAWDNHQCFDDCNPFVVGGDVINLTGGTFLANFVLDPATTISGRVTAANGGAPIANIEICSSRQSDGLWTGCDWTDGNGDYEIKGLEPRNDYEVFTNNLNGQPFHGATYPSLVDTTGGNVGGIDFALNRSATLSGTVTDSVSLLGIAGADVSLFDEQCVHVASAQTDANGDYTVSGFDGGIYRLYADASNIGYIRELYPDVKTYFPCADEFAQSTPFAIADEEQLAGADLDLDIGGIISGVISGPGGPLGFNQAQARMYATDGAQLFVTNNREPDENNSYLVGGIIPGTVYMVLTGRNLGLIDEVYDNVPCPRFSCGPGVGVPIVVGAGDVIPNIDATLEAGSLLSGILTDAGSGLPLAGYSVAIYTETGKYASFGVSDASGNWHSWTGLPAGNYIVSNQFRIVDQFQAVEGGYLPMVYPNLTCGEPCDFLLGTTVTVDGTPAGSVGGIDFAMETGSTITGSVSAGGSPLAGVSVQLRNSVDGSVIRTVLTDGAGNYTFNGVGSGNYFLRTANSLGYEDQLYNGISCNPFCDPLSGNTVNVPADTVVGPFNFSLVTTPTISGTVTDDLGAPVGGVDVIAYDALGTQVGMDTTDASGNYLVSGLYAGDFYVASDNSAGYVDALYDGGTCLPGCDPTDGTAVTLTPGGGASGIDLELGSASVISGNVNDGASAIAGVTVEVYRDTGSFVASATSGGGGNYSVGGLAAGDYHVVTRNTFGYVDEGAGGEICQTTCAPTSTTVVTVGTNVTVTQDFILDLGGVITGTVEDTGTNPLQSVTVRVYNAAGTLISSSTTGPAGSYTINGLANGNVYLRTANSLGYLNQRYDGLDCDALCDVLAGTPVAVSVGTTVPGIDFALPLGGSIAGTVTNASATGIGGVQVQLYDDAGLLAGFAVTAGNGSYLLNGLGDGDYRLKTVNSAGYIDLVRGGDNCSPEPCDIFSGTVTTVASSDETGVNMTLQLGDQLAGVATDGMGVPLPSGTAQVYSATGQLVKEGGIFSGSFLVNGLANGTYHMLILNGSGLVDQLWQSLPCPGGSCDVTTGTPIVLSGAAAQSESSPLASGKRGRNKVHSHGGVHLTFALQRGTRLRGSVRNASGAAVKFANVYFFNSAGVLAGQATTDGLGNFVSPSSFPDGTWYAATSAPGKGGVGGGLIDEIYDDIACAGECNPATQAGTPIVISAGSASPVHFVLGTGKAISGQVTVVESGLPLSVATVNLYKADGSLAGSKVTDGLGNYRFEGLIPGNYYALASHPSGTYTSVLYNGIDCSSGCDVTTGTAIPISTLDVAMVDFALSDGSCPYNSDPSQPDSDGDGTVDVCEENPPIIDPTANVDPDATIGDGTEVKRDALVAAGVHVGTYGLVDREVRIEDACLIGDRVQIKKGSRIVGGGACHVGDDTLIDTDVLIESNVYIGFRSRLDRGVIARTGASIGDDVIIEREAEVLADTLVCDGATVNKGTVVSGKVGCD